MVTNALMVIVGLMLFAHIATNAGEHPLYRPGLKTAIVTGLLCALAWLLWLSV